MHRVRQGDVDRIDGGETVVDTVVCECPIEPVALGDLTPLRTIVTHHGDQL